MGHYAITVDPAELTNAEAKFAGLSQHVGCSGEGGDLGRLHGSTEGWTGDAADACLGEMLHISSVMVAQAPKFATAHDAVQTFRLAVQNAVDDDLVKLNRRWSDADDTYDAAVTKAGSVYDSSTKPDASGTPVSDEDRTDAKNAKNTATAAAAQARTTTRTAIDADYHTLLTTLATAAKTCGDALAAATPFSFSNDQWDRVKGGGPIPVDLWRELRVQAMGEDSFVGTLDSHGGAESEEPEWLETTEKALKPVESTFWAMDTTAFALFNHTAGGGVRDLFTNGALWDFYEEDALSTAIGWEKGLTSFEQAGVGIGTGVKLLDGRALGPLLFSEESAAGAVVGKVGVLGPISVGIGVYSTVDDITKGDYGKAAHDGVETALTAGALLAPPPADLVCGGAALAMAAYDNIPVVHEVVDDIGHAAASAWHSIFG